MLRFSVLHYVIIFLKDCVSKEWGYTDGCTDLLCVVLREYSCVVLMYVLLLPILERQRIFD